MTRNLRFAIFVAVSAFFLFGPLAATSKKRPWLPMRWRMYQGVGVNYCQAQVHAVRDGARLGFPKEALVQAVGRGEVRTRHRSERFVMVKKARPQDIVLSSEDELASVVMALCEVEPNVHAEMRCAPAYPGGRWRAVEDGAANLCERTRWPAEPRAAQPSLDPETGEEIGSDAAE